MKRQDWVVAIILVAAIVAAIAYTVHGLVTETGVVGWLNYAQQSLFGAYSLKLTVLVVTFALGMLGLGAWCIAPRFVLPSDDGVKVMDRVLFGEAARGKSPQPTSMKGLLALWLGMSVATWVIGYAVYVWTAGEQREDAAASYELIVLASGADAPRPSGKHVSLQGRLVGDRVLSHRTGSGSSADYHLVPVVASDWSPGQPVAFIVKVKNLSDLPGQGPRVFRRPGEAVQPEALLARLDGAVPVPAAQEFRKMGVTLAKSSYLVRLVPSKAGQVAVRDTSGPTDFQGFLIICSGITLLLVLPIFLVAREQRKASARAGVRG